jgi:hypothetical protein
VTEMRIYAGGPGDSFTIHVDWIDENGVSRSFPVEIEVQKQDKPRVIGVRVARKPVFLCYEDVAFNAGGKLDDCDANVRAIANRIAGNFPTFGGGRTSSTYPIAHWTKDAAPMFALGVDVAQVVRFLIDHFNEGRA